jgi:hypothetical protein
LKKTASILLLGIFLFNWIGYRVLTSYLEENANLRLEEQLDNDNYDEGALIPIKIPATHLSYYNSSRLFERVHGQVEINGIRCNYVKRRLYNGSIELLCIPNHSSIKLQKAGDDYFKFVNDIQRTGQSKKTGNHSGSSKGLVYDYYNDHNAFNLNTLYYVLLGRPFYPFSFTSFHFSSVIENPPEYSCA